MTEIEIIDLIEKTLDKKMQQNEDFIIYTYYEVNVDYQELSKKEDRKKFLNLLKTKLRNLKYDIYVAGEGFEYNGEKYTLEKNYELIAIKRKEDIK